MNAKIVIDLGFGDSGKGLMTDYLAGRYPNESIVIRFSGGQQAGHTVIHNGVKHVFSSYGAGTLRGIPSYFSEHASIYLNTMLKEKEVLESKGITPELYVHPLAKVTTPYDVAYNRIMEKKLQHGSVGLGIAATMKRHLNTGYKLHAIDLKYPEIAIQKLLNIREYYEDILKGDKIAGDKFFAEHFLSESVMFGQLEFGKLPFEIRDEKFLNNFSQLVFEGSQGIMLDMDHGIFPNVTFANTTSKNAIEICNKLNINPSIYYVTRCYQTRHGNGWMSNQDKVELVNNHEEINVKNEWQGQFKTGELDYNLLNYALDVDNIYSAGLNKNLAVTCLDQRPGFVFDYSKLNTEFIRHYESFSPEGNEIRAHFGHSLQLKID